MDKNETKMVRDYWGKLYPASTIEALFNEGLLDREAYKEGILYLFLPSLWK